MIHLLMDHCRHWCDLHPATCILHPVRAFGVQLRKYDAPLTSMMVPVENSEPSEARNNTA